MRSALPFKRGSSLPWVRGSSLPWVKGIVAERVRLATVGAGGGSTCGVKKGARLGRIGGGGTGGAPAVPTDIVSGRGGGGEVGGEGIGNGRSTVGSGTEGKRVGSSKGKRGSG